MPNKARDLSLKSNQLWADKNHSEILHIHIEKVTKCTKFYYYAIMLYLPLLMIILN